MMLSVPVGGPSKKCLSISPQLTFPSARGFNNCNFGNEYSENGDNASSTAAAPADDRYDFFFRNFSNISRAVLQQCVIRVSFGKMNVVNHSSPSMLRDGERFVGTVEIRKKKPFIKNIEDSNYFGKNGSTMFKRDPWVVTAEQETVATEMDGKRRLEKHFLHRDAFKKELIPSPVAA